MVTRVVASTFGGRGSSSSRVQSDGCHIVLTLTVIRPEKGWETSVTMSVLLVVGGLSLQLKIFSSAQLPAMGTGWPW